MYLKNKMLIKYRTSIRSRSNVKAFMFLTTASHLFIHNYIRYIYWYYVRSILLKTAVT